MSSLGDPASQQRSHRQHEVVRPIAGTTADRSPATSAVAGTGADLRTLEGLRLFPSELIRSCRLQHPTWKHPHQIDRQIRAHGLDVLR
jgi:hypothetical protein